MTIASREARSGDINQANSASAEEAKGDEAHRVAQGCRDTEDRVDIHHGSGRRGQCLDGAIHLENAASQKQQRLHWKQWQFAHEGDDAEQHLKDCEHRRP